MKRFNGIATNGVVTTTSADALSAWDEFSHLRVVEWDNAPADVKLQYPENDVALLEFSRKAPLKKKTIKNPVVRYTIDGTLANYTNIVSSSASDSGETSADQYTTVVVDDSTITAADHALIVVETGEELVVDSVTAATNTLTLKTRGTHGPAYAIPAGAELRPASPVIGETGKLKDSHSTYPGDPSYNYITLSGLKFEMSTMQRNAAMEGEWGTWDKVSMDVKYQVETQLQNSLIFQHRTTYNDADENQVYRGAGLMEQLSGNVLDLGNLGTNFLWGNINDFVNPMFASDLSAGSKDVFCGHNLWADMLTTSEQAGRKETDINISAEYGSKMFTVSTTEGHTINFHNVKGMDGQMAYLGVVLDFNNIGGSEYDGLGPQWFLDLQANDEVLQREAGYFASWETHIYDRSTMGIIRGGTKPLIV